MKTKIEPDLIRNLIADYIVLFLPAKPGSLDDINGLNPDVLKDAYRSRALESHPDRAEQLGIDRGELTEKFKEITQSYTRLLSFVEKYRRQETVFKPSNKAWVHPPRKPEKEKTQKTDKGNDELLFGQFLYYRGKISFKTLLDAVYWQRKGRATYGSIAYKWKIISQNQILNIMKQRKAREKFGECAIRLGYLTETQHKAIIFRQRQLQRPIGEYFVINKIISLEELNKSLDQQKLYNRFRREKRNASKKY